MLPDDSIAALAMVKYTTGASVQIEKGSPKLLKMVNVEAKSTPPRRTGHA